MVGNVLSQETLCGETFIWEAFCEETFVGNCYVSASLKQELCGLKCTYLKIWFGFQIPSLNYKL